MRWPVGVLLDLLGYQMTYKEILEDHPELEIEDIYAAINYAVLSLSKTPLKKVA